MEEACEEPSLPISMERGDVGARVMMTKGSGQLMVLVQQLPDQHHSDHQVLGKN